MVDPLAQFRKTPIAPTAPAATRSAASTKEGSQEEYVAFGGKDKAMRLRIRPANAPTRSPAYFLLKEVVYDGKHWSNFVLYYDFLTVLVRGQNLQAMIFAIETGAADFIQEFDPDRWAMPKDPAATVIEFMSIVDAHGNPVRSGLPADSPYRAQIERSV